MKMFECTLPESVRKENCDNRKGCESCGWEKTECARRGAFLKEHGLTRCKDGLLRLNMRPESN